MKSARRTLKGLAALLPLGALSVSAALAATPGKPMTEAAEMARPPVSQRLATIRDAVSRVTAEQSGLQPGDPNILKAWWGNWGPRAWGNWHPGWGNGGWGNGGWHNWHNGWGNGGWHNFWRNW
jgi:rSAM-associated Gly-rich repeat protein